MKTALATSIAAAAALVITATTGQAQIAYAISNNGGTLISFDLSNPSATNVVGNFSGATSSLSGLDFRPANGLLYGYTQLSNQVVTINLSNAATTFSSSLSTAANTPDLGMDFNPVADRLRIVTPTDQNLRSNVDTGATIVDGNLAYAAGDPNFGVNPTINEAAYTNSDINPLTGTQLYYIDHVLNTLVTTTNPNAGVLNTVGSLGVDTSVFTGFDILSDGFGGNLFYAVLTVNAAEQLYSINPATGAASLIGNVNANNVYGLAIVQPLAPVSAIPEPGTALVGMLALGLCGARLGRRARQ